MSMESRPHVYFPPLWYSSITTVDTSDMSIINTFSCEEGLYDMACSRDNDQFLVTVEGRSRAWRVHEVGQRTIHPLDKEHARVMEYRAPPVFSPTSDENEDSMDSGLSFDSVDSSIFYELDGNHVLHHHHHHHHHHDHDEDDDEDDDGDEDDDDGGDHW